MGDGRPPVACAFRRGRYTSRSTNHGRRQGLKGRADRYQVQLALWPRAPACARRWLTATRCRAQREPAAGVGGGEHECKYE